MLQEVHFPDQPITNIDDVENAVTDDCNVFNDGQHLNAFLDNQDVDNSLIESTTIETDCIDFGTRAILQEGLVLSSVANLVTSVVRTWGQFPLGHFLVAELNIQYPVKSFAPYLGGCRGWVPSDSLRKFLQEVNLYNSFKHFLLCYSPRIHS